MYRNPFISTVKIGNVKAYVYDACGLEELHTNLLLIQYIVQLFFVRIIFFIDQEATVTTNIVLSL